MKVDRTKPLAHNVYTLLEGLLSRRRNEKEWERDLMSQAALELEADDPAQTAEHTRVGVIYTLGSDVPTVDILLPKGTRVYRDHCHFRYRLNGDPKWKRRTVHIPANVPLKASAVQEL